MKVYGLINYPKYLTLISIAIILVCGLSPMVYTQSGRGGDKVVEKLKDFDPPVEIDLIRSEVGVIEPGQKFSADAGWLKGLTIKARNKSAKNITYVSVGLLFPRPQGQNGLDFLEILSYGESPIPLPSGEILPNTVKTLMPGESVELRLADEDYHSLNMILNSSGYSPDIKKLKVYVRMVGFSDGTLWKAGEHYEVDKSQPGRLIPQKKRPRAR
jgi:hypothetical protein